MVYFVLFVAFSSWPTIDRPCVANKHVLWLFELTRLATFGFFFCGVFFFLVLLLLVLFLGFVFFVCALDG